MLCCVLLSRLASPYSVLSCLVPAAGIELLAIDPQNSPFLFADESTLTGFSVVVVIVVVVVVAVVVEAVVVVVGVVVGLG